MAYPIIGIEGVVVSACKDSIEPTLPINTILECRFNTAATEVIDGLRRNKSSAH